VTERKGILEALDARFRFLRALDARFLAAAPPERLATVRVLTGAFAICYLLARLPVMVDFRGFDPARFEPVGFASVLSAPLPQALVVVLYVLTLTAGVAFTLGFRYRLFGPSFAVLTLGLTSYRNSWGMIFHTDNLLVAHVCVLGLVDAGAALSLDSRRVGSGPSAHARFGWPLRLLCAVTATSYLLAGIAKLKLSGPVWMEGEILRNYIAYDALRKVLVGSIYSPFGAWLTQLKWPFPIIGVLTMLIELGGLPALIIHPRLAKLWVLGVFCFHVGVLATMAIAFSYPLSMIAFASYFECERIWRWKPLSRLHTWLSQVRS